MLEKVGAVLASRTDGPRCATDEMRDYAAQIARCALFVIASRALAWARERRTMVRGSGR